MPDTGFTNTRAPGHPACPTARDIAEAVRAGRETAAHACAAALGRIAETESVIHAWCHLDEAAAQTREVVEEAVDAIGKELGE